jgi:hypothetical protein
MYAYTLLFAARLQQSQIGNIGDQFSDLEGLYEAAANYKLPNPVYYIL